MVQDNHLNVDVATGIKADSAILPPAIHVVIPCYRAAETVVDVIANTRPFVRRIHCVDDGCIDGTGDLLRDRFAGDQRINVLSHDTNLGVGAAMVTGYRRAIAEGADVIVKIDADGQMDPCLIPKLIAPILEREADYVKGNRFFDLEDVREMPLVRTIGNAGLSFFSKLSTGYWALFDPSNGFTAIHAKTAAALPLDRLHHRYFFEPDMLFRLSTLRAVVHDVPMAARYRGEKSSLSEWEALFSFPILHIRNFSKRLFYNYFLRNFGLASLNLLLGTIFLLFGIAFGAYEWLLSSRYDVTASAGTVMLAALPIVLGAQQLMNFFAFDMANTPTRPIFNRL